MSPPSPTLWCQLRQLGRIVAVLSVSQICFRLGHFVLTFEFNFWGKYSELFYLTLISVRVLRWFSFLDHICSICNSVFILIGVSFISAINTVLFLILVGARSNL